MTKIEKVETLLKLQGGSKSAIEIATQAVRKCGTVVLVGVYGARYNMFPLGDFFDDPLPHNACENLSVLQLVPALSSGLLNIFLFLPNDFS